MFCDLTKQSNIAWEANLKCFANNVWSFAHGLRHMQKVLGPGQTIKHLKFALQQIFDRLAMSKTLLSNVLEQRSYC